MLTITQITNYHRVTPELLHEFARLGLIEILPDPEPNVADAQLEALERMVRLHRELGINPEGIETVLHMRLRIEALQNRVQELEAEVRGLRARQLPIEEVG